MKIILLQSKLKIQKILLKTILKFKTKIKTIKKNKQFKTKNLNKLYLQINLKIFLNKIKKIVILNNKMKKMKLFKIEKILVKAVN